MRRALLGVMVGIGIAGGCGRPNAQPSSDLYESTVLVPVNYFPMNSDESKGEMKALTIKALDVGSSGYGVVQIPLWMNGRWAINGSSTFQQAWISEGRIEFRSSQREKLKTGVAFLDPEFLVLGAAVSPSGRLFAIHEGIPRASDADSLYAGYLEITKHEAAPGQASEWRFRERNIRYGFGLIQSEPETWTFTRISP